MRIEKMESEKGGKVKISFEDDTNLIFYRGEIKSFHLEEGMDLSEELYEKLFYEVLGKRVKKRALFLLEKMDRTKYSLQKKLLENGYPEELVELALEYVEQFHYIDDERYANNYVRYHCQGKSRGRLKMDLIKKGVPKDFIEQAIENCYEASEEEQIRKLLEKKKYNPDKDDPKEKQRIYAFLMRRGFQSGDVLRILKNYENSRDWTT